MSSIRSDFFLTLANFLLTLPGHNLRRFVFRSLIRNQVHRTATIERGCRVTGRGGVSIGARSIVNRGTLLDGRGSLAIGHDVNISPEVLLLTAEHDPNSPSFKDRVRPVRIESHAWIASRAIVLPGAHIGVRSLVAAGSVVRGAVDANAIFAGNPAQRIGERDSEAQGHLAPYRRWLQ